jgi:hypothetical protein
MKKTNKLIMKKKLTLMKLTLKKLTLKKVKFNAVDLITDNRTAWDNFITVLYEIATGNRAIVVLGRMSASLDNL